MSNHNARRRAKSAKVTSDNAILSEGVWCVWPTCFRKKHPETHLCATHLLIAHGIHERIVRADAPPRLSWLRYGDEQPTTWAATPPTETEKPDPKMGTVYFLRVGGYVKIGWTSDLEKRMRQYMPDSQLLAVKPGTRKDENALHRKFAHLKTHGREWFPLAPQITEEAERIVKEHGSPPVVDFSARRATKIVGPRLNKYVGGQGRGNLPPRTVSG